MRKPATLIFAACFTVGLRLASAQTPAAIQQVDSIQQRRQIEQTARAYEEGETAPELFPGETSDVGPQSILKFMPRKTHFEVLADAQYFHTDNMFLDEHDQQGVDVLVSTAQFALAPTPYELGGGQFAPRLGYRHQWYNFGLASDKEPTVFDFQTLTFRQAELNEFDFNAQTVFTDGRWACGNWIVGAGFDFTRLMDSDDYDQFYRESVPRWGVQRLIPVNAAMAFSIGYEGDYRFTDTARPPPALSGDFNDRTDHSLFVTYTFTFCKRAAVQPYYRFQYTHFTSGENRDDYLNSFGLALYCSITRQISLRAFVGYDIMETSSDLTPDYKKLDAGGGVNLTIRF